MPVITQLDVLIVMYCGVIVGLGIVVKSGGAIDGIEILHIWFNRNYRITFDTFLLAVNVVIINIAAFVFLLVKAILSLAVY
nr:YitT family protein [Gottfriedia luciferensis]